MKDLNYIISLGFSGADIFPAVIIAFFLAMFVWKMALVALFLDRMVWPVMAQALSGADIHTIYATIGAMFHSAPRDLGVYVVRFFGLLVMIALFVALRFRIHKMTLNKKGKPAAA